VASSTGFETAARRCLIEVVSSAHRQMSALSAAWSVAPARPPGSRALGVYSQRARRPWLEQVPRLEPYVPLLHCAVATAERQLTFWAVLLDRFHGGSGQHCIYSCIYICADVCSWGACRS
jgi:hypothetical protein